MSANIEDFDAHAECDGNSCRIEKEVMGKIRGSKFQAIQHLVGPLVMCHPSLESLTEIYQMAGRNIPKQRYKNYSIAEILKLRDSKLVPDKDVDDVLREKIQKIIDLEVQECFCNYDNPSVVIKDVVQLLSYEQKFGAILENDIAINLLCETMAQWVDCQTCVRAIIGDNHCKQPINPFRFDNMVEYLILKWEFGPADRLWKRIEEKAPELISYSMGQEGKIRTMTKLQDRVRHITEFLRWPADLDKILITYM